MRTVQHTENNEAVPCGAGDAEIFRLARPASFFKGRSTRRHRQPRAASEPGSIEAGRSCRGGTMGDVPTRSSFVVCRSKVFLFDDVKFELIATLLDTEDRLANVVDRPVAGGLQLQRCQPLFGLRRVEL